MATEHMVRGADVSMTAEVERLGGVYQYLSGDQGDLFEILADAGVNTVRLRCWVDPYDQDGLPYQGGTNDLETTVALAARAKSAGMQLILDLHYSDFWTDPKKQAIPKSWVGLTGAQLETQVEQYTAHVLATLGAAGIEPEYVQIGNEITNGILWPYAQTPRYNEVSRRFEPREDDAAAYDRLAGILSAGARAVRAAGASQIILHLDFGGANDLYRRWFDEITARAVDFDIIGLSYYPFWHSTLADLGANLNDISARYKKSVLIVETAYANTLQSPDRHYSIIDEKAVREAKYPATIKGQEDFLTDLYATVATVPDGRGLGVVYWEPAWLPVDGTSWASSAGMAYGHDVAEGGNAWANLALFDFAGKALPSLPALGSPKS